MTRTNPSNVLHRLWLQTKQDTTWGPCGQGKFLLERKGFAIRERGTVCIFHAHSYLSFLFSFFFFYQLRPTHLCEGHPKSVNLLLWAQNGPIGKTSQKNKKIDHKTDMIEGMKAPGECKPTIFCKFVLSLGYLPFARVEANQILQAESWGREILKTEQEIRISET